MKKEDMNLVADSIDGEGFDYCFRSYSDFKEIRDKKFHELRQAYIDAAEDLEEYTFGMSFEEYQEQRYSDEDEDDEKAQ